MRRTDETNNTQNVLNDTIDFTKPKVLSKKITVDGEKHDVKTSSSFTVKNNNSKKTQNMTNIASEETFYLAKLVKKSFNEIDVKRKVEAEKMDKICEKQELKEKKYIEALKTELLEKYKHEQNKCQAKIEGLRLKAFKAIERKIQKEKSKVEAMCRQEVLKAVNAYANNNSWFDVAVAIYRADPSFFEKKDR